MFGPDLTPKLVETTMHLLMGGIPMVLSPSTATGAPDNTREERIMVGLMPDFERKRVYFVLRTPREEWGPTTTAWTEYSISGQFDAVAYSEVPMLVLLGLVSIESRSVRDSTKPVLHLRADIGALNAFDGDTREAMHIVIDLCKDFDLQNHEHGLRVIEKGLAMLPDNHTVRPMLMSLRDLMRRAQATAAGTSPTTDKSTTDKQDPWAALGLPKPPKLLS